MVPMFTGHADFAWDTTFVMSYLRAFHSKIYRAPTIFGSACTEIRKNYKIIGIISPSKRPVMRLIAIIPRSVPGAAFPFK